MHKNEIGPLYYSIHKSQHKMDKRLERKELKPWNLKKIYRWWLPWHQSWQLFFEFDTKGKGNESKNKQMGQTKQKNHKDNFGWYILDAKYVM